jgi:urease accessory protein
VDGELRIRVEAEGGEARVVDCYARAPFHYLPVSRRGGGLPLLTLVNSSGGVLGGDALAIEIALGPGAALSVRNQSATKVYRSARGTARARCHFRLADGSLLDYFPEEIIPFGGSDYEQVSRVTLAPRAVALVAEIVAAGRIERGERFAFTRLLLDLSCEAEGGGAMLLRDRADLRPAEEDVTVESILGDATVWGSLYLLTLAELDDGLVEDLDEALRSVDGHAGGVSRAPVGLVGRIAGSSLETVRGALLAARALALAELGRSVS